MLAASVTFPLTFGWLHTTNAVNPSPTANIIRLPRCDGLINEYQNAA